MRTKENAGKKTQKPIVAVLIVCLAMLLVSIVSIGGSRTAAGAGDIWSGNAASVFAGGNGTSADPYIINDGEQLALLSGIVNGTVTEVGGTHISAADFNNPNVFYRLGADIVMNDLENYAAWSEKYSPRNVFTPIGYGASKFLANFDGGSYTITGMYVDAKNSDSGLFGYVSNENTENAIYIKNVNIEKSVVIAANNKAAGSVAGTINSNVVLQNCKSDARIIGKETEPVNDLVIGGIVGYLQGKASGETVLDCEFSGVIDVDTSAVGYDISAGGIIGKNANGSRVQSYPTISNCVNKGTINVKSENETGNVYAGGIIGRLNRGATITKCGNEGVIKVKSFVDSSKTESYWVWSNIGGIAGYAAVQFGVFTELWNTGDIINESTENSEFLANAGGIIGRLILSVSNMGAGWNKGITANDFYNSGDVWSEGVAGGMIGRSDDGASVSGINMPILINCVNRGWVNSPSLTWGIVTGWLTNIIEIHNFVNLNADTVNKNNNHVWGITTNGGSAASSNVFFRKAPVNSTQETNVTINFMDDDGTLDSPVVIGNITCHDAFSALNALSTKDGYGEWKAAGSAEASGNKVVKYTVPAVFADRFATYGNAWGENSTGVAFGGSGTQADPFTIDSAEGLYTLQKVINQKIYIDQNVTDSWGIRFNSPDVYYRLTADIYLNDTSDFEKWTAATTGLNAWTPIGLNESYREFSANFDGGGHTVYGMFIQGGNEKGLFGAVVSSEENRTISVSDLNVADSFIGGSGQYAGGIAALMWRTEIVNCSYSGVIENTGGSISGSSGGICGFASINSVVKNCVTDVRLTENESGGGIIGYSSDNSKIIGCKFYGEILGGNNMGGIAGEAANTEITGCVAYGKITDTKTGVGNLYVGGICGNVHAGVNILGCESADSVVISLYADNSALTANKRVGGIAGYVVQPNATEFEPKIKNCVSSATIILPKGAPLQNDGADISIGGIAGAIVYHTIIENCRTTGAAKVIYGLPNAAQEKRASIGGIAGRMYSATSPSQMAIVTNNINEMTVEFPDKPFDGGVADPYLSGIVGLVSDSGATIKNNVNLAEGYEYGIASSKNVQFNIYITNNYSVYKEGSLFTDDFTTDKYIKLIENNMFIDKSTGNLLDEAGKNRTYRFALSGILTANVGEAFNAYVTENNSISDGTLKPLTERLAYCEQINADGTMKLKLTEKPKFFVRFNAKQPNGNELIGGFFVDEGGKTTNRTDLNSQPVAFAGFSFKGWNYGAATMFDFETAFDRNYVLDAVYDIDAPAITPTNDIDIVYDGKTHSISLNADILHNLGDRTYTYTNSLSASEALTGDAYTFEEVASGDVTHTLTLLITVTDKWGKTYTTSVSHDFGVKIAKAPLSVTGLYAVRRQYNLGLDVELSGGELSGVMSNDSGVLDDVTVVLPTAGRLADKNAGKNKPVSFETIVPTGADANNYTFTQPTVTAEITTVQVSLNGVAAVNKIYDGSAAVSLSANGFNGILGIDDVSFDPNESEASAADKNVGTAKPVTVTKVGLSGKDAGNYECVIPTGLKANITRKDLKIVGLYPSYQSRVYDRTRDVALSGGSLSGVISGDNVSCVMPTTGTVATKNAGSNKIVTVALPALTGTAANNYTVSFPEQLYVDIVAKDVSIVGLKAVDRYYNKTSVVELTSNGLDGFITGDDVSFSVPTSGTIGEIYVGSNKPVTISWGNTQGADAVNYNIILPDKVTVNITPKPLSIEGITAQSRSYDGTLDVAVSSAQANLRGVEAGDNVNFRLPEFGALASADAGTGKTVTINGIVLTSDTQESIYKNYSISDHTVNVNITPREIAAVWDGTFSFVYNGLNQAPSATAATGVNGEFAVLTINNAQKNVGSGYTATAILASVTNGKAENYILTENTAGFLITPREASVTINKTVAYVANTAWSNSEWNGNVAGLVTGHAFSGTVETTGFVVGVYESSNGGFTYNQIAVKDALNEDVTSNYNITYNMIVSITDAAILYSVENYFGVFDNQPHHAELTVTTETADIEYSPDGQTYGKVRPTFTNAGEYTVYFRISAQHYETVNGSAKVSITPAPINVTITAEGGIYTGAGIGATYVIAGNYGDVAVKLNYTGLSNGGVLYESIEAPSSAGSYTVTATVSDSNYTLAHTWKDYTIDRAVATIDVNEMQTQYTYSGVEQRIESGATLNHGETNLIYIDNVFTVVGSGSYTITILAERTDNYLSASEQVVINVAKAVLTDASVGFTGNYDGEAHGITVTANGFLGTDDMTAAVIEYGLNDSYGVAESITAVKVNESKAVYYRMTFDNYETLSGFRNISVSPKTLTIEGVYGATQVYDRNTEVRLITGGKLIGAVTGDIVYPEVPRTGSMADKHTGKKLVTLADITLNGQDANNYTLTQPEVYVDITPRLLSVQGLSVQSKIYDGSASMFVSVNGAILITPLQGDNVSVIGATSTASDANVGLKSIAVSSIELGGDDKNNYTVTLPTELRGEIMPKELIFTLTADGGTYNGDPFTATFTVSGFIGNESGEITLTYKGITNGGVVIEGVTAPALAGNYSVTASIDNGNYTLGNNVEKQFVIDRAETVINTVNVIKEYVYIGYPQIVNSGASLNHTETEPVYSDNVFTVVGTGRYIVNISAGETDNYKAASESVTVTVEKAEYVIEVSFDDAAYVADGSAHGILIKGKLPDGVNVDYVGNGQTEVGVYSVIAKFSGDAKNYKPIADMTAKLTLKASTLKGEGGVEISSKDGFDPDVVITAGNVPTGTYSGLKLDGKDLAVLTAKDVGLMKNGQSVALKGKATIRLLIDEALRGRDDLIVVYIADDGSVENMNAVREGDYMVFDTEHNSVYAIVSFTIGEIGGGLSAGAIVGIVAASLIAVLLVVAIIIAVRRKKKGNGGGNSGGEDHPDGNGGGNLKESSEIACDDTVVSDTTQASAGIDSKPGGEEAEKSADRQGDDLTDNGGAAETIVSAESAEAAAGISEKGIITTETDDTSEKNFLKTDGSENSEKDIPEAVADETSEKEIYDSTTENNAALTPINENAVVFIPTEQSQEEAFLGLSDEQKYFYESLRAYALQKEGSASNMTQNYEAIKIGRKVIVKLSIRKNTTVAAFTLEHPVLKQYKKQSGENEGEAIKVKPTEVFVSTSAAFNAAKDMIDIVAGQNEIEKNEAIQRRKSLRKSRGVKIEGDEGGKSE